MSGSNDDPPTGEACGNCAAALRGPVCHRCGQPLDGMVRPMRALAEEALDAVFDLDARVPRTLWPLFAKPGWLTREYFAGHRVRYVGPVRLFYLLALLAFFVGSLVVSFDSGGGAGQRSGDIDQATSVAEVERIRDDALRTLQRTRDGLPPQPGVDAGVIAAEARVRGLAASRIAAIRRATAEGRPVEPARGPLDFGDGAWDAERDPIAITWLPRVANDWLNRQATRTVSNIERLREDPEPFKGAMMGALPVALALLMPVFALLLKLAYLLRRRLYMEHLVVALHSHAFICLALLLMFLLMAVGDATGGATQRLVGWLEGLLWIWMVLYLLLMQKRVYGQGWPMTLLKFMVLGNVYFVLLGVFTAGAALAALVWM